MHSLSWLATNGTAAIVFFSGILYRGGAEQKIRKYLVDNNYVDCVIQLLSNLFFGTTMATCIIVLKKSKSKNNTFFIDADEDYVKITNNNKLTDSNILHILKAYGERKIKEYFSKLVSNKSIAEKEYTLSVNSYVEQKDTCELVDIKVLNAKIKRQLKGKISFV
jgi:type I restriction enzyme M protein